MKTKFLPRLALVIAPFLYTHFTILAFSSSDSLLYDYFLTRGDTAEYMDYALDMVVKHNRGHYDPETLFTHLSKAVAFARQRNATGMYFLGKLRLITFYNSNVPYSRQEKEKIKDLIKEIEQAEPTYENLRVLAHVYTSYGHCEGLPVDSAIYYNRKSADLFPVTRDTFLLSLNYQALAKSYKDLGRLEDCIALSRQAVEIASPHSQEFGFLNGHIRLADCLISYGKKEQAKKSLDLVREQMKLVDWNRDNTPLLTLCKEAAVAYEHLDLPISALEMYKLYYRMNESEYKKRLEEDLQELRIKHQTQEKENQILALELENLQTDRQQDQILWSAILLTLGLSAFAVFYYQRQRSLQSEANRLKEIDTFKTRLYSNITHEFRTPLTVILGLAAELPGNDQAKAMITRNARQLLGLINRLLDLHRLEVEAPRAEMVQGDVLLYLRYICESFHSMAAAKSIEFAVDTPLNTLVMDYDPEKLRQILYNLLANAVRFTPHGGRINVSVEVKDHHMVLRVADTGIGIAAAELPHLFNRFYQASIQPSVKEEDVPGNPVPDSGGTGIGLALVKELVELLSGGIEVASTEGRGTTFTVRLPVTRQAPRQSGPVTEWTKKSMESPSGDSAFAGASANEELPLALIVEDNADIALYLQTCLRDRYRMVWARDGYEGVDHARELVPDIVISDLMMPNRDGFSLCRILREDERTSHIPIILLTARADAESRLAGLECGADAYLTKPFDRVELDLRLRKLIELRRRLQEKYSKADLEKVTPAIETDPELLFLKKLEAVVLENLADEHFKVEPDLCRAMAMSRPQLYRKLKALRDQSPSEFVRALRLREAHHLLRSTDLPVGEIAGRVGFREHSYFTQVYHAVFGETPSRVRKAETESASGTPPKMLVR